MNGALTIHGDLETLSKLAGKIHDWYPKSVVTNLEADDWGGWSVDSVATLLERLHQWQLLLVHFVATTDGRRSDAEVRGRFALEGSGLRGQTGAISKHIESMKAAGIVGPEASHLLKVDRTGNTAVFVIPEELLPTVLSAFKRPAIAQALRDARSEHGFDAEE